MNQVTISGRLTRDPEVRYTSTGKVVGQITVAVDRPFKNEQGEREADFIPVVVWGKQAEALGNYMTKGRRILVEGRLQIRSFEDKSGTKRWVTEVIAAHLEFIDMPPREGAGAAAPAPKAAPKAAQPSESVPDFGSQIPFSEEIPF